MKKLIVLISLTLAGCTNNPFSSLPVGGYGSSSNSSAHGDQHGSSYGSYGRSSNGYEDSERSRHEHMRQEEEDLRRDQAEDEEHHRREGYGY